MERFSVMGNSVNRRRAGLLEGSVSIVVNLLLFIAKYVVGVRYNSIAVVADSIHTLSDSLTSAVVIVSFLVAYKPADKEHPFGHGRAEQIGAIVIGTLLAVVGFEFLTRSYEKLVSFESMEFTWAIVAVMLASAVVKEVMARWSIKLGREHESQSLIGDAWHHRSDAIASALVAFGAVLGATYWWVDGVLGIAVSVLIMVTAAEVIIETSKDLLGYAPSKDDVDRITREVKEVSQSAVDVHHIHIHKYGDHVEATLHIRLPPDMSVSEAHEIASKIEGRLKDKFGWDATVHVEPLKEDIPKDRKEKHS